MPILKDMASSKKGYSKKKKKRLEHARYMGTRAQKHGAS